MKNFLIDAESLYDQYFVRLIADQGSIQRAAANVINWLDRNVTIETKNSLYIFSQDLDSQLSSKVDSRAFFFKALYLWAQKNNAHVATYLERSLDALGSAKNFSDPSIIATVDMRLAQLLDSRTVIHSPTSDVPLNTEVLSKETGGLTPKDIPLYFALHGHQPSGIDTIAGMSKTIEAIVESKGDVDALIKDARTKNDFDSIQIGKFENIIRKNIQLLTVQPLAELLDIKRTHNPSAAGELSQLLVNRITKPKTPVLPDYPVQAVEVTDEASFKILSNNIQMAQAFGLSIERDKAGIYAISFSFKEGHAFYLPLEKVYGQTLDPLSILEFLRKNLDSSKNVICFSALETTRDFKSLGIDPASIKADCASAKYLLNTKDIVKDIADLAPEPLGRLPRGLEFVNREGQGLAQNIDVQNCAYFSAIKSDLTWKSSKAIYKDLMQSGLRGQYIAFEMRQAKLCAEMGMYGVRVDTQRINLTLEKLKEELQSVYKEVASYYPGKVDFSIAAHVISALDHFMIETKRTASGSKSINDYELDAASGKHPIVKLIQKARSLHQKINNDLKILAKYTDNHGILRYSTHVNSTLTSRLTTTDPNLHGSTEEMRSHMIARKGYVIGCFDISQMELRVLAHLSGEQKLIRAFNEGKDVHIETASEVFGCEPEQVTEEQRKAAKAINFGLIYGMSSFGLAKRLSIPVDEAQRYIDVYFERMPAVGEFQRKLLHSVKKNGYYQMESGRRIYFPKINSSSYNERSETERSAVNAPMQGTAAEIIKRAMIKVNDAIHEHNIDARLILQVHDELIFEMPVGSSRKCQDIILKAMTESYPLSVPIVVEASVGHTLSKKHNYTKDLNNNISLTI
ncbi:DNA polymerase [Pseudomonas luteola]